MTREGDTMTQISIHPASLDDTQSISQLFQQGVDVWQRIDQDGQVQNVAYEQLSIYERWLHGGPWLSIETGAIFLNHLIIQGCIVLVATDERGVAGYAEAYPGHEPAPFGHHLHIGRLTALNDQVRDQLLRDLAARAGDYGGRLTVSLSAYDQRGVAFYTEFGMQPVQRVEQYLVVAQSGQSFYRATEQAEVSQERIDGWHMTIGRTENAMQHIADQLVAAQNALSVTSPPLDRKRTSVCSSSSTPLATPTCSAGHPSR